jgi:glycerophosphoryl diester phosphodiesterase
MTDLSWLVARPIAHRGLHDSARGLRENTLGAADAAIRAGFAIECDVQRTADGDAVVFHDFTLDRLTKATDAVSAQPARALAGLTVGGTEDRIPTLEAFLDRVAGRVAVVCEIKSAFDGDTRLADRTAAVAAGYAGPIAIKSFDPAVIAHLRRPGLAQVPLGIVAEARYDDPEWAHLSAGLRRDLAALTHYPETRPDFLSYGVADLPHAAPTLFRTALRRPVMTWTVRTAGHRESSRLWADQMVFEGFHPDAVSQASALV